MWLLAPHSPHPLHGSRRSDIRLEREEVLWPDLVNTPTRERNENSHKRRVARASRPQRGFQPTFRCPWRALLGAKVFTTNTFAAITEANEAPVASRNRPQRTTPSPAPPPQAVEEPVSVSEIRPVRLRRGERVVSRIEREHSEPPATYAFIGGSFRQISAKVGELALHYDLSKRSCHLILVLIGIMERGNLIRMTQAQMAKAMASVHKPEGWDRTDVSKLLASLREIGVIYPVPKKRGMYRLNPKLVFYGTAAEQERAIAEMPHDVPEINLSPEER